MPTGSHQLGAGICFYVSQRSAKCLDYKRACAVTSNCSIFPQMPQPRNNHCFCSDIYVGSGIRAWLPSSEMLICICCCTQSLLWAKKVLTEFLKGPLNLPWDVAIQVKQKEKSIIQTGILKVKPQHCQEILSNLICFVFSKYLALFLSAYVNTETGQICFYVGEYLRAEHSKSMKKVRLQNHEKITVKFLMRMLNVSKSKHSQGPGP